MIGSGVPVGAKKPFHDDDSKPGTVSEMVGKSGAAGRRCDVLTAINRIASLLINGKSAEALPKYRSATPPIRSEIAAGSLRA